MSKVTIEVNLEAIKKAASQLPEDEKEELILYLNPELGKALKKMENEALYEVKEGKGISWDELKNESSDNLD